MDFNDGLTQEFVVEAREHMESIEEDLLLLEQQRHDLPRELIDRLFRAIHSIKGSAGCIGFQRINELAHTMETLLAMYRSGEMRPEASHVDALLAGCDFLNRMLDDVSVSNDMDISVPMTQLNALMEGSIPIHAKREMNTPVDVGTIFEGNIHLEIDEHTIKHIPEEHRYIYFIRYDFVKFMSNTGTSPVTVISELNKAGEILTAQLQNQQDDLDAAVLDSPLYYDVLYSTVLEPMMVEVLCGLPQDQIQQIERASLDTFLQNRAANTGTEAETPAAPDPAPPTTPPQATPAPPPPVPETPDDAPEVLATQQREEEEQDAEEARLAQEWEEELARKAEAEAQAHAAPPPPPAPPIKKEGSTMTQPKPAEDAPFSFAPGSGDSKEGGGNKTGGTVRLSVDLLDELMGLAGELILARNQLLTLSDKFEPATRAIVQRLDIVASELQEAIMRTRMQPVGNVFGKLPRIVRDLAKKLGKEIEITTTGQEVELDKTIVEALTDPLTHMIRNCCDHGIGDPEFRQSQGKSRVGTIQLHAFHEGGQINIVIRDDGRGIDPDKIRKKILERNLKSEAELDRMSTKEICNLVMLPGFSTAEQVSDVSGRGVGMDVVRACIEKLGGTLDLTSDLGVGTTITLRLPLTLAIIPSLIIRSHGRRYAIPQVNVEELICIYEPEDAMKKVEYAGDQEVYRLRGQLLPIVRLNEVLERREPFTEHTKATISRKYRILPGPDGTPQLPEVYKKATEQGSSIHRALIFGVMNVGSRRFGLSFDDVIGTEEIVVKPMHAAVQALHSYAGATVLGDGDVALILDMEGVGKHADAMREIVEETEEEAVNEKIKEIQPVLLFQAGPREQFAVPLSIVRRIERIETDAIERIGEREYITINDISTLIVRVDQQLDVSPMPEGTANLLLIPKHIPKPVGFLFSRVIDVKDANLELKDAMISQQGILGSGILLNKMTIFLDLFRLIEKAEPDWFADRKIQLPGGSSSNKVLLVEDTAFFRNLVKKYLEDEDFDVTLAEDGLQALNLMREQGDSFRLLVSDLEMPKMDGWELIRQIRKTDATWATIPSVALTSHSSPESREKAMSNGYDRFEVKIDREALLSTIKSLIQEMAQTRA